MKLSDIADQLTVWDPHADDENMFLKERLRIYDTLYYDHLPVLREADVVTYDQNDDMVDLGPTAAAFQPVVERTFQTERDKLRQADQSTFKTDEDPR